MSTAPPVTLSDLLPLGRTGTRTRDVVLVVGFALLTAASAQFRIHLNFTPVPITGQTFAVLLAGAALGWRRGAASQSLYWVLGAIGLPFYADGDGGWDAATGATFGYFVGFVAAAVVVGVLAERHQDRALATSVPAMLTGSAVIYVCGVAWLAHSLDVPVYSAEATDAIDLGLAPFVVGDLIKLLLAGLLTPLAWRLAAPDR